MELKIKITSSNLEEVKQMCENLIEFEKLSALFLLKLKLTNLI
jgi:hypothetical protein